MAEFNAFARKYGFRGCEDHVAVWGRIFGGELQGFAQNTMKETAAGLQKEMLANFNKPSGDQLN